MRLSSPGLQCEGCTQFSGHGGARTLHAIKLYRQRTGRDDHPCSTCPLFEARTEDGRLARKLSPLAALAVEVDGMMNGDAMAQERYRLTPIRLKASEAASFFRFAKIISQVKAEHQANIARQSQG